LPWDPRIHARTQSINADGSWRNKRGVDIALVAQVEAELRGGTPPGPPAATTPPATNVPQTQQELTEYAIDAAATRKTITHADFMNAVTEFNPAYVSITLIPDEDAASVFGYVKSKFPNF
jgi:hypothetical protein